MKQNHITFHKTGFFSSLICDYLDEKPKLNQFYNRFPKLDNFQNQITQKGESYSLDNRKLLTSALNKQYENIDTSELTSKNIELLNSENAFTITTGHQLNLFTGPLYFLYKIVSTINLSKELNLQYPKYNFVPVYWMATEDHDFDEINYFNFKGKKFQWNKEVSGAVGDISTEGLDDILQFFSQDLGNNVNAENLIKLFKNSYLNHDNLTDATRYLANELFKDYGLVIIDANNATLKREFIPYMESELQNQTAFKSISRTNKNLSQISDNYKIQVNPREINLFYLEKDIRERIVFEDGYYKVLNTNISWDISEMQKVIIKYPERFSPNVIMRPLYQEIILPNLCYIGGGGELAYWMQLKDYFDEVKVPFPILQLRNSVLIQTEKQSNKLNKLNIISDDIFLKRDAFINKKVRDISNIEIDFSEQKETLKSQFEGLYKLAEQTDKSFMGSVKAQEVKQLKGLENLEKRLLKAQKRKLSDEVERMIDIQNELFPNGNLQERATNFSEFYLVYGEQLIPNLIENLKPLKNEFIILTL